jgi:UDP-N-acetylglucosamine:LPS N-acetylglucosamine transferase
VGGGHDVAARRISDELRERGATVEVEDGLALIGRRVERFVVSAYRRQLEHAPWSWRLTYRLTRSRVAMRLVGALLCLLGGRRLAARIEAGAPDVVVSAYPLVSSALAALVRRGRLRVPAVTLITDFDVHPAWVYPDLAANYSVAGSAAGVTGVRPPVGDCRSASSLGVREGLGIGEGERMLLVAGGAGASGRWKRQRGSSGRCPGRARWWSLDSTRHCGRGWRRTATSRRRSYWATGTTCSI